MQVYNNDQPDNVKFTLSPIGTAYKWQQYCGYYESSMDSIHQVIRGNHIEYEYFFSIDNPGNEEIPENQRFILGLLEIKVEIFYDEQLFEDIVRYFYWDVRDCQYYSPQGCPQASSFDITLRYDAENYIIWYYPGPTTSTQEPSESGGWENVNNQTKNAWDRVGLPHCPLDFSSVAPNTPSNFQLSGDIGQHPILTWNENSEPDVEGYKIYVSYNNSAFALLYTITDPSITNFTDGGVTITGGRFDPTVCYKISAYDIENYESEKSIPKCIKSSSINKSAENDENLVENLVNSIEVFPNPINPKANLLISVAERGQVFIAVFNILGEQERILIDEFKEAGIYNTVFDGVNLASGTYIVLYKVNDYYSLKMLNLVK